MEHNAAAATSRTYIDGVYDSSPTATVAYILADTQKGSRSSSL